MILRIVRIIFGSWFLYSGVKIFTVIPYYLKLYPMVLVFVVLLCFFFNLVPKVFYSEFVYYLSSIILLYNLSCKLIYKTFFVKSALIVRSVEYGGLKILANFYLYLKSNKIASVMLLFSVKKF